MSNKSVRIPTTVNGNDKYLRVKLENDVDFFEILSLNISQKDVYGTFNSDYGVIVGRVVANGGVGIPNAKLSVFIPITDDDKLRADIVTVYPYTSPRDKDLNGVRYNLLPRVGVNNPFLVDGDYAPKVPIGTFPTKEEITTNETYLEVYQKYYKFTTVTNTSGDYMIFGVPIGIQTVHMSVDITDIGKYSMNPPTMITNLGYSPNLFTENGTKIKFSTDLETLPNVETQEVAVEVRPFWGDVENFEIGITRQDFKIRALLLNSFVLFGSAFTDGENSAWANEMSNTPGTQIEEFYRIQHSGNDNVSISSKRNSANIKEKIFYYPASVSDANIEAKNIDTSNDIKELFNTEYTKFTENGQFVYVVSCNRKKIITNEFGFDIEVDSTSTNGIFTEFKGFIIFEYSDLSELPVTTSNQLDGRPIRVRRLRYKFPQSGTTINSGSDELANENWRKQYYTFNGGELYSVAKFHHLLFNDGGGDTPNINNLDFFNNVGIIVVSNDGGFPDTNSSFQFPTNGNRNTTSVFGGEWLNFCIHFPQQGFVNREGNDRKTNSHWTSQPNSFHFINNNTQLIASNVRDTIAMARNDTNQTSFIKVPKEDIINILSSPTPKGFRNIDVPYVLDPLIGVEYKSNASIKYFYKGFDTADCIIFLNSLGLV